MFSSVNFKLFSTKRNIQRTSRFVSSRKIQKLFTEQFYENQIQFAATKFVNIEDRTANIEQW